MSKYTRTITQTLEGKACGAKIEIDVYDVLTAFGVMRPSIQHAVKKLLCSGIRGSKDEAQDLCEAAQSIQRALNAIQAEAMRGELIDAEFEIVPPADAPQVECPFKIGDIIAKPNSTGWKIDRILSDRLHVTSDDPYQTPSQIDRQFWGNYRIISEAAANAPPQPCPFLVGDTIRSIKWPNYVFRVTEVGDDQIMAYNQQSCSNHVIPRALWNAYEVKTLIPVDKPQQTC